MQHYLYVIFMLNVHPKLKPRKVASLTRLTRSIEQLLILKARSSVCLFYLGLNMIKVNFLTLIDSLFV